MKLILAAFVLACALMGFPGAASSQSRPQIEHRMPRTPGGPILIGNPKARERVDLFLVYSHPTSGARRLFLAITGYSAEHDWPGLTGPVARGEVLIQLYPAYRYKTDLWVDMAARCSRNYVRAMQRLLLERNRWASHRTGGTGDLIRVPVTQSIAAIREILVPGQMSADVFESCVFDKEFAARLLSGFALRGKDYPIYENTLVAGDTWVVGWLHIQALMIQKFE